MRLKARPARSALCAVRSRRRSVKRVSSPRSMAVYPASVLSKRQSPSGTHSAPPVYPPEAHLPVNVPSQYIFHRPYCEKSDSVRKVAVLAGRHAVRASSSPPYRPAGRRQALTTSTGTRSRGERMKTGEPFLKTLLKPSEASAHFNIPLSTIYFWYQVGNIDGINVSGRCLRIFSKSLQEFLGSRTSVPFPAFTTHQGEQRHISGTVGPEGGIHVTTQQ
jgi:hypothetical protein